MTQEQIEEISTFKGDQVEELWKPGNTEDYLDVYYYWKLREVNRAGVIEGYASINTENLISKNFIAKIERIPQYYHSAYSRLAALKIAKKDIDRMYGLVLLGANEEHGFLYDKIEIFYSFLGSVLDNIAAVGHLILRNPRGTEDSFSDFCKNVNRNYFTDDEFSYLQNSSKIKKNYRDHLSHRPRMGLMLKYKNGIAEIHWQDKFIKSEQAENLMPWRKEFREIFENRITTDSVLEITTSHFETIEKTVDIILKKCFLNYDRFLELESMKRIDTPIPINTDEIPIGSNFILFSCERERDSYLKYWLHKTSEPLPTTCTLESCKSEIIRAVYFIK